jgi:hypothetical protein
MKKIFIILFISISSISYADVVDNKMQTVFQELSEKYIKKYPAGVIKKGLAVLDFTENSEKAKRQG